MFPIRLFNLALQGNNNLSITVSYLVSKNLSLVKLTVMYWNYFWNLQDDILASGNLKNYPASLDYLLGFNKLLHKNCNSTKLINIENFITSYLW